MSDSYTVIFHNDFYSVIEDGLHSYWVVNNLFTNCSLGPFDKLSLAYKIYLDANHTFEFLRTKGDI